MLTSRRNFIQAATALTIMPAGFLQSGHAQQASGRIRTPELTLGPFYPLEKPADSDADLTWIKGRRARALGEVIDVQGIVFDSTGTPLPNRLVEVWQANNAGRYAHPNDRNTAPLDPNFQGYAALRSDAAGRFRLTTIKPAGYPDFQGLQRPPHIHFKFDGGATQMFFPGEAMNGTDGIFRRIPADQRAAVLGRPDGTAADGRRRFRFDIVLG